MLFAFCLLVVLFYFTMVVAREKYFNILLTPTTQRITLHKGHEKKIP